MQEFEYNKTEMKRLADEFRNLCHKKYLQEFRGRIDATIPEAKAILDKFYHHYLDFRIEYEKNFSVFEVEVDLYQESINENGMMGIDEKFRKFQEFRNFHWNWLENNIPIMMLVYGEENFIK